MGELVLIYGRDFVKCTGGAENYVEAHCHAATDAGYSPQVFSVTSSRETCDAGFAVIHRNATPIRHVRPEYATLQRHWLARPVVDFLRDRQGPHIIHSFGPWADSGIAATRALARLGVEAIPVATSFETVIRNARAKLDNNIIRGSRLLSASHRFEYAFAGRVTARAEGRAYQASRVVLVNYDSVRTALEEEYGTGMNVRKVPYAPASAFEPEAAANELPVAVAGLRAQNGPLVVSTSRHVGRKGLDLLIRALAGLRDDGVEFHAALVGEGILLERHRRLVASLGLDDRIVLPGLVPDVRQYLQHADLFVLPSIAEGSGSVSVLEALQAGVAVVSSAVDGMPEDLTDGRDAVLVESGSIGDLQLALGRLIGDAAQRERIAHAGRELFEARFTAQRWADSVCGLYTELGLPPTDEATPPARAIASATRSMSSSFNDDADGR